VDIRATLHDLVPHDQARRIAFGCCMTKPLVLLVLALGLHTACGTSCPEIREQRNEYDGRKRSTRGPDARLALPFKLMDRVIAGQLDRRPPVPIKLPTDKIGMPMSLSLTLDRVTTHAAGPGQLGMTLHLALLDPRSNSRVLELEVDTTIAPKLGTSADRTPEFALVLRPQDLGTVRPHTTPEGTRTLGRWLRDSLPTFARALATDQVVEALAQESLQFVASDIWPHAKERLLGSEPLLDTHFALPDLPIRELALSSTERALIALMTTELPDAEPIEPTYDRVGERMILRLSGGTAMGLVNRAMDRGEVPSRFDEEGKPKADGIWETRVGWRGGSSPLVVHLWRTQGACKNAEAAARLVLALQGDKVRVDVQDGRITSVAGPAFAEAFAWLGGIFSSAMEFTFDTDAFVRFDSGDQQVQVRLAKIALGENDLVLELDLGLTPR